jgi:hypothetical protein
MDWDLFLRLAEDGPAVSIDTPLATWRWHASGKTESGGVARLWEICRLLRRHHAPLSAPSYRMHLGYACKFALRRVSGHGAALMRSVARHLETFTDRRLETVVNGGRWDDGWAARYVRWRADHSGSSLQISGSLDSALYPRLRGQVLTVSVDGDRLARELLPEGDFELVIPIRRDGDRRPLIELRASRSFVPRRMGFNQDRRRLAYRLSSLTVG